MTGNQFEILKVIYENKDNPDFKLENDNGEYEVAFELARMDYISEPPEFHIKPKGLKAYEHYVAGHQRDLLAEFDVMLQSMLNSNGTFRGRATTQPMYIEVDPYSQLTDQMIADGYLVKDPDYNGKYLLTSEGRYFIMRGGFKAQFEYEEKIKELNKKQIQSTIDTNKSVKSTNKLFILTIAIALFGVVFQGITWYNDSEKKDLKEQLRRKENQIRSLESKSKK